MKVKLINNTPLLVDEKVIGEYTVSKDGTIRNKKGKILKWDCNQRYARVTLYIDGKKQKWLVHRLVATLFLLNPYNKPYINHIDGNQYNNSVENLEWCTQKENVQHAWNNGLSKITDKKRESARKTIIKNNKLKRKFNDKELIQKIRNRILLGESIKDIAVEFGVSRDTISSIKNKRKPYDS